MDPDTARPSSKWARLGARNIAHGVELSIHRNDLRAVKRPDHLDLLPPEDFRDPDSGRRELAPDSAVAYLGRYLRRARSYAQKTQQQIADESGVSQSMVSRAERGRAPGMRLERFLAMCQSLGRLFPLGACPHEHECGWQPIKRPERHVTDAIRYLESLLKIAGD